MKLICYNVKSIWAAELFVNYRFLPWRYLTWLLAEAATEHNLWKNMFL